MKQSDIIDPKTGLSFKNFDPTETNESYHASVGLSNSGLKLFAKTPRHFLMSEPTEETASQRIGTLTHMAILEPDRFAKTVVAIDGHRGSKDVKEAIAIAEANGSYVCKTQEFRDAVEMAESILLSKNTSALLTGGIPEASIRAIHPELNFMMKCKPDYFIPSKGIVVDLKTFTDLDIPNIERQVFRMKYHWQSIFYLKVIEYSLGIKTNMFCHVFIDTKAKCARTVILDDAALDKAWFEIEPLLVKFAECWKSDVWPGYADQIETITLPHYGWSE